MKWITLKRIDDRAIGSIRVINSIRVICVEFSEKSATINMIDDMPLKITDEYNLDILKEFFGITNEKV